MSIDTDFDIDSTINTNVRDIKSLIEVLLPPPPPSSKKPRKKSRKNRRKTPPSTMQTDVIETGGNINQKNEKRKTKKWYRLQK